MKSLFRNTLVAVGVIALGGVAIAYFSSASVPRAFFESRLQAAGAANNLAVLINNSLANLQRIEQYENNNSNDQALELLSYEIDQKQEKQNAAVFLASSLEQMAQAAMTISSAGARGLAIEAVTSGVSMVSRIVSYNNSLDQLFTAIQSKLRNGSSPAGVNIRTLLATLNNDGKAINDLNNSFNAALKKFDQQYGVE
jgi:hypothetical protein